MASYWRVNERTTANRVAQMACGHRQRIGGGDKVYEKLFCSACTCWQPVVEIETHYAH